MGEASGDVQAMLLRVLETRRVSAEGSHAESTVHVRRIAATDSLGIRRPSIYNLIRVHPELRTAEDLDAEEIRRALEEAGGVVREAARSLEVSARALARKIRQTLS